MMILRIFSYLCKTNEIITTTMKTPMITKKGRLSKVWANHFRKNRSGYSTFLQEFSTSGSRIKRGDECQSISIVPKSKIDWDLFDVDCGFRTRLGRRKAFEGAIFTFNIYITGGRRSQLDMDFIDIFGELPDYN